MVFDVELQDRQDRKGLEVQTGRKGKFMRSAISAEVRTCRCVSSTGRRSL